MSKAASSQAATVEPHNQNLQQTEVRFGLHNLKAVLPSESLALQSLLYSQRKYRSPSTFIKDPLSFTKANSRTSQGLAINSVHWELVLKQKNDHLRGTGSVQILQLQQHHRRARNLTPPLLQKRGSGTRNTEQQRHLGSVLVRDLRLMWSLLSDFNICHPEQG